MMKGTGMNAYLVWCDNGESYEDSFRYVDGVLSSWDGAARYLDSKGLVRKASRYYDLDSKKMVDCVEWVPPCDNRCVMGLTACRGLDCDRYRVWAESDSNDTDYPCEDYESLLDNDDRSYWFIEEYKIND